MSSTKKKTSGPQVAERKILVQFSRIFGGFCLIFSLLSYYRRGYLTNFATGMVVAGVLVLLIGLIRPTLLNWFFFKWILLGEKLSFVMTKVVVFLTFYVVITPVGLFLRLIGKDILALKFDRSSSESYFTSPDPESGKRFYSPF